MKISILCSSEHHPVNVMLYKWIEKHQGVHDVNLVRCKQALTPGNLLLLISCIEKINEEDRAKFDKVLLVHASDLPKGRGWSPLIWEILNGAKKITVSLLEAAEEIDGGDIWKKVDILIPKHALYDEINNILFEAESELMDFAVDAFSNIKSKKQNTSVKPTYFRKRTPADSEIDPNKSLKSQFDHIRVCDPQRFPAFFYLYGYRYKITLEKLDDK